MTRESCCLDRTTAPVGLLDRPKGRPVKTGVLIPCRSTRAGDLSFYPIETGSRLERGREPWGSSYSEGRQCLVVLSPSEPVQCRKERREPRGRSCFEGCQCLVVLSTSEPVQGRKGRESLGGRPTLKAVGALSFYPLPNRFTVGKGKESLEGRTIPKDVGALSFYYLPNRFTVGKVEGALGDVLHRRTSVPCRITRSKPVHSRKG